jgi:hypothetical protein
MPYDEGVAQRVREAMDGLADLVEKKMFGGLAFMACGNMCCGVIGEELMARVGADGYESALSRPHARQMDFTGKPLKGFVYVAPAGFESDDDLQAWVNRAVEFVHSLPAK